MRRIKIICKSRFWQIEIAKLFGFRACWKSECTICYNAFAWKNSDFLGEGFGVNIGFYDPISERWIKPRPEKTVDSVDPVSLGEALLNAIAADALKKRNEKIWEYLKQSAEGCNAPTASPVQPASEHDAASLQWDSRPFAEQIAEIFAGNSAPIAVEPPADYEPEFSLGYIYWKPKDGQCSGQQE